MPRALSERRRAVRVLFADISINAQDNNLAFILARCRDVAACRSDNRALAALARSWADRQRDNKFVVFDFCFHFVTPYNKVVF